MKPKLYLYVTAGLTLIGAAASAEPTLYPKDLQVLSSVVNTTDSNILADEVDSKTVWVMPPNTATANVQGLHTKTANMGFCAEMKDLIEYSRDMIADIKAVQDKRNTKQADIEKLQTKASGLLQDAEKFAVDKNLQALADLDTRLAVTDQHLSDLYKESDACTNSCEGISHEISIAQADKQAMTIQRMKVISQNTADQREYLRRRKLADAAQTAVTTQIATFTELKNELFELHGKFDATFSSYGSMPGAAATFIYKSNWNDNVSKLRAANPGINFSKVATKNANLMTELTGLNDLNPQGAVMSIGLGGNLVHGSATYPAYPESLSTNVNLSLIGACPMEHPEYFDLKADDAKDMKYGVMITYDYDSIFRVKAIATYNMYKMYQKIVSSGSSSGFFSSHSWSSVEEKNYFQDSFTVKWDDRENTLSADEKLNWETEARRNVMMRLATLALPNSPNRADILLAAQPPQHGAVVASDELMKTCSPNIYCVGTAAVLRVLDAIFGSSSSNSSYTNIQDITSTENYEDTQKITKSWITSYL